MNAFPLLITLELDAKSQGLFQRLRDQHFPPERNIVPAHVSLFHALPAQHRQWIEEELASTRENIAFPVQVTGVRSMGRGVLYVLCSEQLQKLHARLAGTFAPWLTAQDRQPYRQHLVVQNKTTPERARTTLAELQSSFQPFEVHAEALLLWSYLNGPWRLEQSFRFRRAANASGP